MEHLKSVKSLEVAHSLVADGIVGCVRSKLLNLRLVSLWSAAMVGIDSSPMAQLTELVSIVTQSEFGELGQSTQQLADQADFVGAQ